MRIRIISDLHLDVNHGFPFSLRESEGERDDYCLVAGDVSGNPKLTARWLRENVRRGCFVAGNHDPAYNDSGQTIQRQKEYLHGEFPVDSDVTFLDQSVGVVSKLIPDANVLVVGTTLYTDYQYMDQDSRWSLDLANKGRRAYNEPEVTVEQANFHQASRGLNDFRWGHVPDEFDDRGLSQRHVRPDDYQFWFRQSIEAIDQAIQANPDRDVVVMTHHCPSPRFISPQYVHSGMNASYVSDLEGFMLDRPQIRAWVCGHVHHCAVFDVGPTHQLMLSNPRGYEAQLESRDWNPNTFLDTDSWKVVSELYSNPKLEQARQEAHDRFMKYAPLFI